AVLAGSLLSRCPDLTVLATSREALDIPGEAVIRLGALATPDAVQLFLERAGTTLPGLRVSGEDAEAVEGICARFGGNGLAIGLAARRVRMLPVTEILRRLDDRFGLLTTGTRTASDRHRDLRAAIGWSHDLLDDAEKVAFRRLSVLVGGLGLDAAAAV